MRLETGHTGPASASIKSVLGLSKSNASLFLQRLRAKSARAWGLSGLAMTLLTGGHTLADESPSNAQSAQFNQYHEKAAYLLNFTRYVEWPTKSFKDTNSPIVISLLGQDRFGEDLRNLSSDKIVQGR